MSHVENNIEDVLERDQAKAGDRYIDELGNHWIVQNDRDGLRLTIEGHADAWIPYWTAMRIQLPGLHRV